MTTWMWESRESPYTRRLGLYRDGRSGMRKVMSHESWVMGLVVLILLSSTIIPQVSPAAGPDKHVGTSGASFLKIYPGVRYEAQGGAGVADAADVDALYWNPAGIARSDHRKFGFTYNNYIADINLNYLTYVHPTEKNGVYGVSLYHLDAGRIGRTEVDAVGDPVTGVGSFGAYDMAIGLSYARPINHRGAWGVTIKSIQSKLDAVKGSAWAADVGLKFKLADPFSVGFAMQNFGTRMKFQTQKDKLPRNYKFGAAYHTLIFANALKYTFTADMNIPSDNKIYFNAGNELFFGRAFALRFGFDRRNRDTHNWLTAGFGLYYRDFDFNYAYTPYGDLKHSHRIGFGYTF